MELDLKHLLQYARRWWWLIVLIPILTGGAAYFTSSRQDRLYLSTATLQVNLAQNGQTDLGNSVYAGQVLVSTYQEQATAFPVLERAAAELGPPYTADYLAGMITAGGVRDTLILRISASDTDPARAALVANTVAKYFIEYQAEFSRQNIAKAQEGVDRLITETEAQVSATRARIDDLRVSGGNEGEIEDLQSQLAQQESALTDFRAQKAALSANAELSQNSIVMFETARAPLGPYAPRIFFYTMLGIFIGGILALGVVAMLEYFDNTVKPSTDFAQSVGAPLLSVVGMAPKMERGREQLFVLNRSSSTMAESIRLLRTNIEFAAATKEIASMAVTSAAPSEGKSTITANLAIAMAQSGFSVVVIDADLRRPSQHRIFDVTNARGLTTLLTRDGTDWRSAGVEVINDLWLIPSGPIPPNPADLLASDRMKRLLEDLSQTVDIVLVDTPPALVVSDPLVIATNVDAVLLVSRANRTRIESLRRAASILQQGSVRLIGVVLNQQAGRSSDGYYYYYASEYYTADKGKGSDPGGDSSPPKGAIPAGAGES